MKKIMTRAAKSPFEPVSPVQTLKRDTIGSNSGNLLFAAASHLLLSTQGTEVDTSGFGGGQRLAEQINANYDGAVLPLANIFRPGAGNYLQSLADTINNLKVPFAMLSGGAQLSLDSSDFGELGSIEKEAKAFFSAVLDKSSSITVRGARTAEYVQSLGFSSVEVIGCPSMTRMGRQHRIATERVLSEPFPKFAYSIQPRRNLLGPLLSKLRAEGAQLTYVAQDVATLEMLIWSREVFPDTLSTEQPTRLDHPEFVSGNVRFYLDASTWINDMRAQDAYIGTRIHGALSGISAGIPSILITHDSRTLELAEYHGIPHVTPAQLIEIDSIGDLRERIDFREFEQKLPNNVDKVVQHLNRNGFETTLDPGREKDRTNYFHHLETIDFPQPVRPADLDQTVEQIAELRRQVLVLQKELQK